MKTPQRHTGFGYPDPPFSSTQHHPDVEIRETPDKGLGVFAKRDLPEGFTLPATVMATSAERDHQSIEIEAHVHATFQEPWIHAMNHACGGYNMAPRFEDGVAWRSLRKIRAGEELTWHYGCTEYRSMSVEKCQCGALLCDGRAHGYAEAPKLQRKAFESVAPHLTAPNQVRGLTGAWEFQVPSGCKPSDDHGVELANRIGMNVIGFEECDCGKGHLYGPSLIWWLETSNITLHAYGTGLWWLDVSSCKPFRPEIVTRFIEETWQGKLVRAPRVIER